MENLNKAQNIESKEKLIQKNPLIKLNGIYKIYPCKEEPVIALNNIKINKMVYIISLDKINGEYLLYNDAINHLINQYMPVILISDNFVIIKTEDEYFYLT